MYDDDDDDDDHDDDHDDHDDHDDDDGCYNTPFTDERHLFEVALQSSVFFVFADIRSNHHQLHHYLKGGQ